MPPNHKLNVQSLRQHRINPMRRIFVRDLVLQTRIGVHEHEKKRSQRIRALLFATWTSPSNRKRGVPFARRSGVPFACRLTVGLPKASTRA